MGPCVKRSNVKRCRGWNRKVERRDSIIFLLTGDSRDGEGVSDFWKDWWRRELNERAIYISGLNLVENPGLYGDIYAWGGIVSEKPLFGFELYAWGPPGRPSGTRDFPYDCLYARPASIWRHQSRGLGWRIAPVSPHRDAMFRGATVHYRTLDIK